MQGNVSGDAEEGGLALPLGERTYRNALVRIRKDLQELVELLR